MKFKIRNILFLFAVLLTFSSCEKIKIGIETAKYFASMAEDKEAFEKGNDIIKDGSQEDVDALADSLFVEEKDSVKKKFLMISLLGKVTGERQSKVIQYLNKQKSFAWVETKMLEVSSKSYLSDLNDEVDKRDKNNVEAINILKEKGKIMQNILQTAGLKEELKQLSWVFKGLMDFDSNLTEP